MLKKKKLDQMDKINEIVNKWNSQNVPCMAMNEALVSALL